ncbi:unnamed protein product [Phytophthora fragariaefolia]|uniref:Unnamed protein product n=1 Tax=Phytophthora fragariaefolia TaxID=1490495 RepID=A0A9W6XV79_9STRA|nr:unnamed protein product [Phytophthora fragariaefolia]
MGRKRLKVSATLALTPTQREALSEVICASVESGAQIAWRRMLESAAFTGVAYDTLRREGKAVQRQLSKQGLVVPRGPLKRHLSEQDEAAGEPLDARTAELEALVARNGALVEDGGRQIKALEQQVAGLDAAVAKRDEQLDASREEQDKLHKQVEALQQCVSELSAIIASKDAQLEEANGRYDTLLQGIRQLASRGETL